MRSLVFVGWVAALCLSACAEGATRPQARDAGLRNDADIERSLDGAFHLDSAANDSGRDSASQPDSGPRDADRDVSSDGASRDADAGMRDAARDAISDVAEGSACHAALATARFDFESGADGFSHAGMDGVTSWSWTIDPWEIGAPSAFDCPDGNGCAATTLDDNYAQCQRGELRSPAIDLSACRGQAIALVFDHSYAFWRGEWASDTWSDGGIVEVSTDGVTWHTPSESSMPGTVWINPNRGPSYSCLEQDNFYVYGHSGYVGSSDGVRTERLALDVDLNAPFYVRFAFASGVSSETTDETASRLYTGAGWYVDAIRFEELD